MNPRASIIVPLLRQEDTWLRQSVESALGQRVPCEVIVAAERNTPASNLETLAGLAAQWSNLRVLMHEPPASFPGSINLGWRAAATERIGLLLSDDWLEPDTVAECLALDADIVCTGHTVHWDDGATGKGRDRTLTLSQFQRLPTLERRANYLEHFFLFGRAALARAGGLDESIGDYPGIDDYDLIWTLLEQGASVGIVEKPLYHYRDHDGCRLTLADPAQASRNLARILTKHGVCEPELSRLVAEHSRWYGKPIHRVRAETGRA